MQIINYAVIKTERRIYQMTRREAREIVLTFLYEKSYRRDETELWIYENSLSLRELSDNEYIKNTYFGVWDNLSFIDGKIAGAALEWTPERMSRVTLSIMRLCVYELYFDEVIPVSVSLNEAIELAKIYGEETAPAFINGILNNISKDPEIIKPEIPRKK